MESSINANTEGKSFGVSLVDHQIEKRFVREESLYNQQEYHQQNKINRMPQCQ